MRKFLRTPEKDDIKKLVYVTNIYLTEEEREKGYLPYDSYIECRNISINGIKAIGANALKVGGNMVTASTIKDHIVVIDDEKEIKIKKFDDENIIAQWRATKYEDELNIPNDTIHRIVFEQERGTSGKYDLFIFEIEK